MEFDELKKAWGQFNDKINCQEVVERQQVEEMLAKKRMTSYNRLLWYERISLGILFFLFLNVLVYILIDPFFPGHVGYSILYCHLGTLRDKSVSVL